MQAYSNACSLYVCISINSFLLWKSDTDLFREASGSLEIINCWILGSFILSRVDVVRVFHLIYWEVYDG